jgi:hypothetical protein
MSTFLFIFVEGMIVRPFEIFLSPVGQDDDVKPGLLLQRGLLFYVRLRNGIQGPSRQLRLEGGCLREFLEGNSQSCKANVRVGRFDRERVRNIR